MPRRDDLHKILILGSGPIVIGQAAEFDYSGVQACKVLRDEGYEVVLVNSNPATIMTDPEFAEEPATEGILVMEMNPRVSGSSALASKATGFPIAKIAARLAVGYTLEELPNDITEKTPASFEPTIDYTVVKIPRWAFEKFPGVDATLGTQMKSVGEVMAIGRTFKEAFLKGVRSLERRGSPYVGNVDDETLRRKLIIPNSERIHYLHAAFERGWTADELFELTSIDPWFLNQLQQI